MAVVALVLGLLGLILGLASGFTMVFGACCIICTVGSSVFSVGSMLLGIAAGIIGALSVKRIKDDPMGLKGRELAIVSIVLGAIAAVIGLVTLVLPWLGMGFLAAASHRPPAGGFGR